MKEPIRLPLAAVVLTLLVVMSLFAGCGGPAVQEATATPTRTPRPPTNTPEPSPTLTATLEPTATPEPTATLEPTATMTPTLSAALLPREPGVSIFTGLRPADPSVLDRRPLAVKVDNDPAVVPQSGMGRADVVVESPKEACMTRFTAIFQSQDAARIGSIRSARIVDKELPVIFDAILAFSGGVEPVRQMLYKSEDLSDQVLEQARNGAAFFRDPNIRVPFNLFANTDTLWKVATQKGWNKAPEPTAAWVFSEGAPEGGAAATSMSMPFPRNLPVSWTYDAGSGRWLRSIGGNAHMDKAEGKQISAANVVVLTANTVQTLIPEQGTQLTTGPCSNASVEVQLWGRGPVRILRDGQVYEGQWVREGRDAPFRFVDALGRDLPLKPGNSWWQIVSPSVAVTIQ